METKTTTRSLTLLALSILGAGPARGQVDSALIQYRNQLIHTGAYSPGTVSVTQSAGVYTLAFSGDETISYRLDTTDPAVMQGAIRVYEATSDCWPVRDGGVCYRSNPGFNLFPAQIAQYTTLSGVSSTSDSVLLTYTLNYEGVHRMRTTYKLTGKNLRIRVQDLDGATTILKNWSGLYVGPTMGTEEPKYLTIQGALCTPMVLFRKGAEHFFLGNMLDMANSNAAHANLQRDTLVPGMTSVRYGFETFNLYKKVGSVDVCGRMDDTLNVTISSKIKDVLVTPNWGGSPYRELLTQRMMMDIPTTVWNDHPALWNLLESWGVDDLAGYYFRWTASAPEFNGESLGPDWYPALTPSLFSAAIQQGNAKGYILGCNTSFSLMHTTAPPAVYDATHISRTPNGTWKLGAQSGLPMMAVSAAALHAAREGPLIKSNYGVTMGYVDIQSYAGPSGGADGDHLDQYGGTGWARTLRQGVAAQQKWLSDLADLYQGPLAGEGSIATADSSREWLWAGYCDSVQRCINSDSGINGGNNYPAGDPLAPTNYPVIPEYEVRVMSRVQANHGNGYYDRFFGKSDGAGIVDMGTGLPIFPITEAGQDKYRAYVLTHSKMTHLECNGPYNGIGNYLTFNGILKSYYLCLALQKLYFDGEVTQIQYMYQGSLQTFEQILFQTETCDTFRHPQIKEVFSNGLELYVNHNPAAWSVIADGVAYVIPEDGFVAVRPGTLFLAFSAIPPTTGGQRIDYCYAPNEYEFFDGRGVINGYGNLNTAGVNGLKFLNFVHNVTGTETPAGAITLSNGTPPTVVNVDVLPAQVSLARGMRRGMRAIATYSNGSIRNVTSLVDWSTGNAAVATINEGAALTARTSGQTTINVTSFQGAPVTPATITVVP